jgi:hypothetical protein
MTECRAGFHCAVHSVNQARCPKGHACPHDGACDPTPCERGTYNPHEGRRICDPCPAGYSTERDGAIDEGECSVPDGLGHGGGGHHRVLLSASAEEAGDEPAVVGGGTRRLHQSVLPEAVAAEAVAADKADAGKAAKLAAASSLLLVLSGVAARRLVPRPAAADAAGAGEWQGGAAKLAGLRVDGGE